MILPIRNEALSLSIMQVVEKPAIYSSLRCINEISSSLRNCVRLLKMLLSSHQASPGAVTDYVLKYRAINPLLLLYSDEYCIWYCQMLINIISTKTRLSIKLYRLTYKQYVNLTRCTHLHAFRFERAWSLVSPWEGPQPLLKWGLKINLPLWIYVIKHWVRVNPGCECVARYKHINLKYCSWFISSDIECNWI